MRFSFLFQFRSLLIGGRRNRRLKKADLIFAVDAKCRYTFQLDLHKAPSFSYTLVREREGDVEN